jgi:hypothetical protein
LASFWTKVKCWPQGQPGLKHPVVYRSNGQTPVQSPKGLVLVFALLPSEFLAIDRVISWLKCVQTPLCSSLHSMNVIRENCPSGYTDKQTIIERRDDNHEPFSLTD